MGLTEQIPGWALTRRDHVVTLVGSDSPRGDGEGFGDGSPRRVWVVFGVGPLGAGGQDGAPESDGGTRCRARGGQQRAAIRP